ncbi:hypothetical protein LCX93_00915 [Sulfurimonas sp. SWIR-19]|uniref:hypothetical protein n=1 Tax=Sulfurimonas sp. SWIR-19 TaxID=2878390 RepID=UPI001CF0E330|nr:hypothetical protein [Sulfurimonas sp. SWIR-19]UCN00509.1 hypothetical protein LCX93_00915 [Sulfurimonas sp. SWIR-19]
MNSNDKYNKLVYEIGQLKNGITVKPQAFSLEYNEFKSIIDEIERDNLFNEGRWALSEEYIFMGLTFKGRSFIESNDGKQYSKIEKIEVANHTHINVGHTNNGNIVIGNNNIINSEFNQKFDDLVKSVKESNLQDKENILKELDIYKNDETALKKFMGTLLSRGAEVASITSAIGTLLSL